jgi:hypothetical protein
MTIEHLDKLDTVGWFMVGLPHFGLMRDGAFRAIGCDSIYEDGSVLLVAQGIKDTPEDGAADKHLVPTASDTPGSTPTASTKASSDNPNSSSLVGDDEAKHLFDFLSKDPVLDTMDIPQPPTRMGSGRMTIRTFQALIHIESPTDATSKLVTNIDPNLPLIPQSLIDFLMKRLCGVLLSKMQSAAKKVSKDPVTNPHAVKMREERDFYEGWLLPKFKGVCQLHGWEMPPVSAFALSEAQLDLASALLEKRKNKTNTKTMMHYRTMSDDRLHDYLEGRENRSIAGSEPASVGESGCERGANVRMVSVGSDDMSDLSRNSSSISSLFRNNPISSYLREVEEQTQLRKAREMEKSRQKAANRLKPKELDEDSRSRLEELRLARERRTSNAKNAKNADESTSGRSFDTEAALKSKRSWADFWTRHGAITRLIVVSVLTSSLFYLLYLDVAFDHFVALHDDESFWISRGRDATAIAYMGIAGMLHTFLCYVLLMYAFSSLQIGAIAGKQAKEFYSQNIHLVLGVASASMIVLGAMTSTLLNAFQWMVWKGYLLAEAAGGLLPPLPEVPSVVAPAPFGVMYGAIAATLSWAEHIVFESNLLGRGITSFFGMFWDVFQTVRAKWSLFVQNSVAVHEGTAAYIPWREQAFVATRSLFSYSATFLLVLLLLFSLAANRARRSGKTKRPADESSNKEQTQSDESVASSTKSYQQHQQSSRSATPVFDTIEEHKALDESNTPLAFSYNESGRSRSGGSSGSMGARFRGRKAQYSSSM